jgi:hypothetical protein
VKTLALIALAAAPLAAQEPMMGVRSEMTFARMPGASSFNSRPGFTFGPTVAFKLTPWFAIQTELLYSSFGGSVGITGTGPTFFGTSGFSQTSYIGSAGASSFKFLQLPVMARLDLGKLVGGPIRPVLFAGPQVSYMLSCRSGYDPTTGDPLSCGQLTNTGLGASPVAGLRTWDVGAVGGVGLQANLFDIIQLGGAVRYQRGLTSISALDPRIRSEAWSLAFSVGPGNRLMHGGQGYSDVPMSPEDMATLRSQRRGTGAKVQAGVAPGVKM